MEITKCTYQDAEKSAYLVTCDLQSIYDHTEPGVHDWRRLRSKIENIEFFRTCNHQQLVGNIPFI